MGRSNWKFDKVFMIIPKLYPKSTNAESDAADVLYRHQEDELLEQASEATIEWNAEEDLRQEEQGSGWDEEQLMTEHRMVALFTYNKFTDYINMLPAWLSTTS